MKKLFALLMASALCLSSAAAFAQEVPKVMAGEREISMDEVDMEYVDGVLMIPVRRLCSVAGAECDWYGDEQKIVINTKDSMTRIFLYIGSDELHVFTFKDIINGTSEYTTLEAPLKIVNDRTLVPFEQLCRALKLEYEWSEDKSLVTIKTGEVITDALRAEASIVADKEDVNAGDIVEVSVILKNMGTLYPDYGYNGYSAGIIYNFEEFELVSSTLTMPDGTEVGGVGAENAQAFRDDQLMVAYVNAKNFPYEGDTMIAGKIVLKALTDNGGTLRLSDRISSRGQNTTFVIGNLTDINDLRTLQKASELKLDVTELVIK